MTTQWVLGPSLVMAFVIGLCLVISYLMPRLTRPDVYFAVTVPPEFRDSAEGCSILKRYRAEVTIFGVLALLIVLAAIRIPEPNYLAVVTLAGLFLQGAGVFLAYYRARGRVLPARRRADDGSGSGARAPRGALAGRMDAPVPSLRPIGRDCDLAAPALGSDPGGLPDPLGSQRPAGQLGHSQLCRSL